MTATSLRPANAGAITRMLGNAGLPIGRETKASRGTVRGGWSNFSQGFTSTQEAKRTRTRHDNGRHTWWTTQSDPTGYVTVDWQFSDHQNRHLASFERAEVVAERLAKAADVLRGKGFEVETTGEGDRQALRVCRKDADGNVVRY